jgi:hypothetical protein
MHNPTITPEHEITWIDKSDWGDGPWQSEPDKVQWTDEATGLPCLAVRNSRSGAWCGYVGVVEGHPAFGLSYDAANNVIPLLEDEDDRSFEVHGGLTFADFCQEDAQERGICHVPQPGQPERVWWLGFDCAHAEDMAPGSMAQVRRYREMLEANARRQYRPLVYVQAECVRLAQQLAAVAEQPG